MKTIVRAFIIVGLMGSIGIIFPLAQKNTTQKNLLYTTYADRLIAFGWSDEKMAFEQVWESAPLRVDYVYNPRRGPGLSWLIEDYTEASESEKSILALDAFGILAFDSHRNHPRYSPFSRVGLGIFFRREKQIRSLVINDGRVFLVQRGIPRSIPTIESLFGNFFEVFSPTGSTLKASLAFPSMPHLTWSLEIADLDEDGSPEILTGGSDIHIFTIDKSGQISLKTRLPFPGTLVDVIRIGDVDGDEQDEIVATGNSKRVTVYDIIKRKGYWSYPVVWQTEDLGGLTQGLALANLTAKPGLEILCATTRGREALNYLRVFEVVEPVDNARRSIPTFQKLLEIRIPRSNIPGITVGDLTGDGESEIVLNGRIVYHLDKSSTPWSVSRTDSLMTDKLYGGMSIIRPSLETNSEAKKTPGERWLFTELIADQPEGVSSTPDREMRLKAVVENVWQPSKECDLILRCYDPKVSITKNRISVPPLQQRIKHITEEAFTIRVSRNEGGYIPFEVERVIESEPYQIFTTVVTIHPATTTEHPLLLINVREDLTDNLSVSADRFLGDEWGIILPNENLIISHEAILLNDALGLQFYKNLPAFKKGFKNGQKLAVIGQSIYLADPGESVRSILHAEVDSTSLITEKIHTSPSAPLDWPDLNFSISVSASMHPLIPIPGAKPLLVDENGAIIAVWWENPSPGAYIAFSLAEDMLDEDIQRQIIEALIRLISKE